MYIGIAYKTYEKCIQTLWLQVKAFTNIGDGPAAITSSDTSEENHVPLVLLTTSSAVELTDIDNNEEIIVSNHVDKPIDVAYLTQEQLVYWLDDVQGIMVTSMKNNRTSKVRNWYFFALNVPRMCINLIFMTSR